MTLSRLGTFGGGAWLPRDAGRSRGGLRGQSLSCSTDHWAWQCFRGRCTWIHVALAAVTFLDSGSASSRHLFGDRLYTPHRTARAGLHPLSFVLHGLSAHANAHLLCHHPGTQLHHRRRVFAALCRPAACCRAGATCGSCCGGSLRTARRWRACWAPPGVWQCDSMRGRVCARGREGGAWGLGSRAGPMCKRSVWPSHVVRPCSAWSGGER